ncbi:2'-5' RNA ligase family protein [Streptomyces millisiae]|uniref:2'-5' RNA ligase family protein n=1 Tax=Streptomyces millisiae TaxID=3075542 RepID=A0ABU2M186_9ACTN|nr:2'-5' RNA ligase family protein [Streptomyces sp. DSM 44918]MDT0323157.1 2'-5' RNA ligase family protein [Streptomyces sp. DSM 44918]
MKPFVFQHAQDVWPEGETLLHVYLTPHDQDRELAALVARARAVLQDFPITCVEDRWLHITVDQITDRVGRAIPPAERQTLVDELTKRLADIEPFDVMIGSLMSYATGVIADVHPDGPLDTLHTTVRAAIQAVRGPHATGYPTKVPHLTLGYAAEECDSDQIQRKLRNGVRPGHAPIRVDAVHLVDVTADAAAKTITWDHVASIALGAGY